MPVWPSGLIDIPGWGATTSPKQARVGLEQRGGLAEDLLDGGVGDRLGVRVHDDLHRGGGVPAEVFLRQLADLHRLRAVGLPAGTGQRVEHARRRGPERHQGDQPDAENPARPPGHRGAQPAQDPAELGALRRP
jgi:hypothetical protein